MKTAGWVIMFEIRLSVYYYILVIPWAADDAISAF